MKRQRADPASLEEFYTSLKGCAGKFIAPFPSVLTEALFFPLSRWPVPTISPLPGESSTASSVALFSFFHRIGEAIYFFGISGC